MINLPETHVRCPDCTIFVLKDANACMHCGAKLTTQSESLDAAQAEQAGASAAGDDGGGFLDKFLRSELRSRAKAAMRVKRSDRP